MTSPALPGPIPDPVRHLRSLTRTLTARGSEPNTNCRGMKTTPVTSRKRYLTGRVIYTSGEGIIYRAADSIGSPAVPLTGAGIGWFPSVRLSRGAVVTAGLGRLRLHRSAAHPDTGPGRFGRFYSPVPRSSVISQQSDTAKRQRNST